MAGSSLATLLVLLGGLAASGSSRARAKTPIIFTQSPVGAVPARGFHFRGDPPDGSRIVLLDGGRLSVLTDGFSSACDPSLSFDGTTLLFAAKKSPEDQWNIWEMDIDGTGRRQITSDFGDCREPAYLARSSITAPEFKDKVRWIVYTSTAAGTYDESGKELATALYVQNLDPIDGRGTVTWRITFNLSHDFSPTALADGRILFSSWQQGGHRFPPNGMIALMTMNWAGTGLNAFYGNHQGEKVKSMACEMPDRTVVFVESGGGDDVGGQLARVSFKRPLHSHETLSNGKGRYMTPHSFPDGNLAVSYKPGGGTYGIYLFDDERRTARRKLYDDPDRDDLDPVPVVAREEPMGRITIVVDNKETAHLQCLNVYDSDRPEAAAIEPGSVKRVRFVEGLPSSSPASPAKTRVLGEAPVESDGSFHVEVPADTPFYLQTLDEDGMALQTMRGWMWVRRGSRRGCIGCHENKEFAPENRATLALIKAEPTRLLAPPSQRRTVDFRRNVASIIEKRCAGCHSNPAPKGGLDLGGREAVYGRLMQSIETGGGKYVHPGSARTSPLIRMIFGESGKAGNPSNPMEDNHPHVPLDDHERRALVEWIDLGAQWDAAYEDDER